MKSRRWLRTYGGREPLVLAPGDYSEARCYRCGQLDRIITPAGIDTFLGFLKGFERRHKHCRQSLMGARYDLILALYSRKWRLEHEKTP